MPSSNDITPFSRIEAVIFHTMLFLAVMIALGTSFVAFVAIIIFLWSIK